MTRKQKRAAYLEQAWRGDNTTLYDEDVKNTRDLSFESSWKVLRVIVFIQVAIIVILLVVLCLK